MVETPFWRPVLIWCLLWTRYIMMIGIEEMNYREKKEDLARMSDILADKIMMATNRLSHPSTVNLTISVRKKKILRFMFGASIRSGMPTTAAQDRNKLIDSYEESRNSTSA